MRGCADQILDLLAVSVRELPFSWDAAEAAIGIAVPDDYKSLIDRTGALVVDEWLTLFAPDSEDRIFDIAALAAERERAWGQLRRAGIELPTQYFATGKHLVPFAAVDANYFFWCATAGISPNEWSVLVVDADIDGWHEFEMSATDCIYRLLQGRLGLEIFDDLFISQPFSIERRA